MDDGIALAEALLGLEGFRVLDVVEEPDELVVTVESMTKVVGCARCGVRAEAQDRMAIDIRDLTCFGRPARLVWIKRRWRCVDVDCDAKTWTEQETGADAQAVLTRRAGAEACRQVGQEARPVARVAAELGVCWWTVMNAVIEHGTPLVDDPGRIGAVTQLGVDETSFLRANRAHATIYATGLVDLQAKVLIDMVKGNTAADLRRWTKNADPKWIAGIKVVATDLAESFRAGLSPELRHYQAEGVLCVEMEAAALFAVAAYRDVDVAAGFVISDSLADLVWDPQFHAPETLDSLIRLYDASVATLMVDGSTGTLS